MITKTPHTLETDFRLRHAKLVHQLDSIFFECVVGIQGTSRLQRHRHCSSHITAWLQLPSRMQGVCMIDVAIEEEEGAGGLASTMEATAYFFWEKATTSGLLPFESST